MTSEKSPNQLYKAWSVANVELQALISQSGLSGQTVTGRDIPRGPILDLSLLEEIDRLDREQRELWQAYRASLESPS